MYAATCGCRCWVCYSLIVACPCSFAAAVEVAGQGDSQTHGGGRRGFSLCSVQATTHACGWCEGCGGRRHAGSCIQGPGRAAAVCAGCASEVCDVATGAWPLIATVTYNIFSNSVQCKARLCTPSTVIATHPLGGRHHAYVRDIGAPPHVTYTPPAPRFLRCSRPGLAGLLLLARRLATGGGLYLYLGLVKRRRTSWRAVISG